MERDVVTQPEDDLEFAVSKEQDPDEFFAKNAFRIIFQSNNFFLPQLRDLIEKGEVLNLQPEYQRRARWSNAQKSKLIESLLLNIPVPPVFLFENEAARYEVMDGQQRLSAVRDFIAGDFALRSLQVLKPLEGLRYSTCPPRVKRALDRASVSAIVLLLESETERKTDSLSISDIRQFIFDRLNTGGTKLNAQEIRNALNPGAFNNLILELSRAPLFTEVFGIPAYSNTSEDYESAARRKNTLYATMGDCQLVLRYFALKDHENIRGSMRSMLDRAMSKKISEADSERLKIEYLERLDFLNQLFEGRPFLLPRNEKGQDRTSAALYDASMVAIDAVWDSRNQISLDSENVRNRMNEFASDLTHLQLITGQANTANAVRQRIDEIKKIFLPEQP